MLAGTDFRACAYLRACRGRGTDNTPATTERAVGAAQYSYAMIPAVSVPCGTYADPHGA
jgi:hypothetical protein